MSPDSTTIIPYFPTDRIISGPSAHLDAQHITVGAFAYLEYTRPRRQRTLQLALLRLTVSCPYCSIKYSIYIFQIAGFLRSTWSTPLQYTFIIFVVSPTFSSRYVCNISCTWLGRFSVTLFLILKITVLLVMLW